jgi:hypothetical protein
LLFPLLTFNDDLFHDLMSWRHAGTSSTSP